MGKMFRSGSNVIRPRKPTNWASEPTHPKRMPIFRIGDDFGNHLAGDPLSYDYYSNQHGTTKASQKETTTEAKKTVLNQLEKYCENTTLHGLRYVGDSQLTFGERIFWFISFTLAICFAAYYITNIYAKWKSSPVIISFSPWDAELSSIPFPAITICNMNQAKKSEAERILKEGSIVEKKLLDDACNGNASFDDTENISWTSLRDFLVRVGNSCSDILKSCQWGSDKIDCDSAFNNDLTDEGLCCSFNRLPPEKIFRNMKDISILNQTYPSNVYDWDAEKGFQDMDYEGSIPRRPLGAGAHLGLSVILDAQIDNYYCSSTRSTGFKVILSNPIETPKMADFGFLISPGFETRITIEPSVREATSSLRDVPIEKRQCYFSNERPLQYYRHYSKKHCVMECYAKISLLECGCLPHFLPSSYSSVGQFSPTLGLHLSEDGSTELRKCDFDDECSERVRDLMLREAKKSVKCNCLSSCFEVDYDFNRSRAPLRKFGNRSKERNYSDKYIRENFAKADFFFESDTYPKTEKMTLYDFTDLVAYTGGLLGFFVGFSFLSGVELFFYLIWLSWKEYRQRRKCQVQNTPARLPQPSYTQMNCLQECRSNISLRSCHCVPYYLPKNHYTVYCGMMDDNCTNLVKNDVDDFKNGSYLDGECHCKPGCFEVNYKYSVSESSLLPSSFPKGKLGLNSTKSIVAASFFFRQELSQKQVKGLLYGFAEILSSFGGILSLCLGISFLSIIELAYFASLRLLCMQLKKKIGKVDNHQKNTGKVRRAAEPIVVLKGIQMMHI